MKRILIIFCILLSSATNTFSQDTIKLKGFREIILPEYSSYFKQAELTENNGLNLSATDKYIASTEEIKKTIIGQMMLAWQDSLLLVNYGSKRELWGWSAEKGKAKIYDQWDYSKKTLKSVPVIIQEKSHPWFFYVGGQINGDNMKNTTVAINLRVGFFLLLNRWDFAASFSGGISSNSSYAGATSSTGWSNVGLMSRVHFPIKKTGFSPYIGAELTKNTYGETSSDFNGAFVLGFSWFVGFGSIDIGVKLGEFATGIGGYTMYPGVKK